MKYIDTEKLKCLLDAKYKDFVGKAKSKGYTTLQYQYMADGIDIAEQLIDSLQQEQPEINIPSAGSGAMGIIPPKFKLDVKEQSVERLGEEFEKEFAKFSNDPDALDYAFPIDLADYKDFARHFAEWGRKQVLQEIYEGKVKPVDKITAAWLDDESKAKEDK